MDNKPIQLPQQPVPPLSNPQQNTPSQSENPQPTSSNKNKALFLIGGILSAMILLGIGGYAVYSLGAKTPEPSPTPIASTPSIRPSPTQWIATPTTAKRIDADLLAAGSSYADTNGVYSFLYPSDFKLDTSDPQHPRIYKTGSTQQGQTEMYDGVMVVFETIQLQEPSLNVWVDEYIKTRTADGTSQVTSPKKPFILETYQGFMFEMRGLGTATYYALQKDTASKYAVLITTSVNDPQNVDFQTDVDKIFSTIELHK